MCAGKSSLLAALLGEMYNTGGTVTVAGSTGYAAQDPWIQNATLRDNILMGSDFDQARYASCPQRTHHLHLSCALTVDHCQVHACTYHACKTAEDDFTGSDLEQGRYGICSCQTCVGIVSAASCTSSTG